MTKIKKAIFGIGIGKEAREQRKADRQLKRAVCRGGKCGGKAKGFVGYKDGGKMKKTSTMAKMTKAKKGGSFDLNKDGKTTFKDVLIGRGVLPKTARKGTKLKKAQPGEQLLKFATPSGNKATLDTSGMAAGKKRFPMKLERTTGQTQYGTTGRKSAKRSVAYSEGKPYKKQTISSVGQRKAKKALGSK